MTKKKIVSLSLVIALLATLVVGGTMAYFMDKDAQTNTFTVGNVAIDLFEDFNTDELTLVPAVGSTDPETNYATYENTIEKEVYVENTGSEEAYVRVHIAIPDIKAGTNVIDILRSEFATVNGTWIWGTDVDNNYPPRDKAGEGWNFYKKIGDEAITIDGVPYKVFCVTYETALENGDVTCDAIDKVYMDPATTNDEITAWNKTYGDAWKNVYVVSEAVQADGFDNAVAALDEAFGVPGTYAIDFKAAAEGKTFVEMTGLEE